MNAASSSRPAVETPFMRKGVVFFWGGGNVVSSLVFVAERGPAFLDQDDARMSVLDRPLWHGGQVIRGPARPSVLRQMPYSGQPCTFNFANRFGGDVTK